MENIIKRYMLSDGRRLTIGYEEGSESPRERDNTGKLCLREHRHYKFPNELDYDWDSAEEDAGKLYDEYHIFELDCYEHSGISFSLAGQGMQCRFDTSNNVGFIAIPKTGDGKAFYISENEAKNIAEGEIKCYNQYLNGEVYRYTIEKPVKCFTEHGKEWVEREYEEGCGGYYDIKNILDEFKDLNPNEIE